MINHEYTLQRAPISSDFIAETEVSVLKYEI